MTLPFTYYHLIEAFDKRGCALCHLLLRDVDRLLNSILYEYSTDPAIQQRFRDSRGLCAEHGMRFMKHGSALNIAILMTGALDEIVKGLAQGDSGESGGRLSRMFGGRSNALLEAIEPTQTCIACEAQAVSEKQYLGVLGDYITDKRLQAAFRQSDGLCLPHFKRILATTKEANLLVDIQRDIWARLKGELDEFIRKSFYEHADEAMGAEADSWQRVVTVIGGAPTIFGAGRD